MALYLQTQVSIQDSCMLMTVQYVPMRQSPRRHSHRQLLIMSQNEERSVLKWTILLVFATKTQWLWRLASASKSPGNLSKAMPAYYLQGYVSDLKATVWTSDICAGQRLSSYILKTYSRYTALCQRNFFFLLKSFSSFSHREYGSLRSTKTPWNLLKCSCFLTSWRS